MWSLVYWCVIEEPSISGMCKVYHVNASALWLN